MIRFIISILFTFLSVAAFGQRTEKVQKTIVYCAEGYQSIEQAKQIAVEQCKIAAIDSLFGANVAGRATNIVSIGNGKEVNEFVEISNVDVRGRWIKDLDAPKFGKIWYENNLLNITVTVKGKVREIVSSPIECKVKVMCDGTDEDNVRNDFKDGNDLYLSFTSPVDGYLVIYYVDDSLNAFRVLPYYKQNTGAYRIEANREYIFFSEEKAPEEDKPFVEGYSLDTNKDMETNQLYVIFSPNKFTKPIDKVIEEKRPRQLSWKEFQSWFSKCLNNDEDMIGERPILLHITK